MTKQITSKQIRKDLSRQYNLEDRFEDEEFGKALIASTKFREIAEQLEKTGYQVEQVRQTRYILDPLSSTASKSLGHIYLKTEKPLKIEDLKEIKGLGRDIQQYEGLTFFREQPFFAKYEENSIVYLYENKQPPTDGVRKAIKTLVDRIVDPCVIREDTSVRIK